MANFCIFSTWKYVFDTYKGFLWKNMTGIRQILQQVPAGSQNIKGFLNFSTL
jgi:hypothetical protein